ncbi:MAG: ABC transporter permease [Desulfobacterales bacterium]|nr:ABC transporter permease [Desulfobacterales bacterium]
MMKHIGRKLPQLLLVMLGASFLTFSLSYMSPGDPAEMMFEARGMSPTQEALDEARERMGLNSPFIVQYGKWLGNIVTGDLGISYTTNGPVSDVLKRKIPMTLKLAAAALVFLVFFSLIFGVFSALYRNRIPDFLIRGGSFAGISVPDFWLGLILIYLFVVKINWFRITDPYAPSSVILPGLTLAIPLIGRYTRQIRAAILEELSKDYVIGARARGIRETGIVFAHVLPNALTGLLTLFGLSTALLLGGTVIVETIFSWPGLGSMAMEAITLRDYPLLQSYVILMAFIYVMISFLVDLITQLIDPRVREQNQ